MSQIVTKLSETEDQVLDSLQSFQEDLVETFAKVVGRVESAVPEVGVELDERLPRVNELVESQFDFVAKLLENQRKFVLAVLEAAKPLTSKVVAEPTPKARPKATAKAA